MGAQVLRYDRLVRAGGVGTALIVPDDIWAEDDLKRFKAWLDAIDCGRFFDRFVQAGYDFAFTAKVSGEHTPHGGP
jgi:hypothetical protein